jgi:hypothetical protein
MSPERKIWRLNAALLCWCVPAVAQEQPRKMPCAPYKELAKTLADSANERRVSEALGADGRMWVMFSAPDGATWSMVAVDPRGNACFTMVGKGFTLIEPEPQGAPA